MLALPIVSIRSYIGEKTARDIFNFFIRIPPYAAGEGAYSGEVLSSRVASRYYVPSLFSRCIVIIYEMKRQMLVIEGDETVARLFVAIFTQAGWNVDTPRHGLNVAEF